MARIKYSEMKKNHSLTEYPETKAMVIVSDIPGAFRNRNELKNIKKRRMK